MIHLSEAVARRTTGKYASIDLLGMSKGDVMKYLRRRKDIHEIKESDSGNIVSALDDQDKELAHREVNKICKKDNIPYNSVMWFEYQEPDGPDWIIFIGHINDTLNNLYFAAWESDNNFRKPVLLEYMMVPYGTHWTADSGIGQELDEIANEIEDLLK